MAASKSNRSVKNKQSALSIQHSAKTRSKTKKEQSTRSRQSTRQITKSSWLRKIFRFPQAKGKIIESTEFSTELGYHCISINFTDKTSLNLAIDASFTVETDYSDWKTGNQRLLRRWRPVQNLEFRDTLLTNKQKETQGPSGSPLRGQSSG